MCAHLAKLLLLSAFTLPIFQAQSQNSNVLLDRHFWKQKPSVQEVKSNIEAGNDPAELNRFAFDPVVYAILEKAPMDVMKLLLAQDGNEVNKITHDGRTFIFWAAYKDNLPLMQHLLEQGAKTDIIDDHGYSLLNFTAVTGQTNPKLYDFILANGASVKTERNHDGANALLLVLPHLTDQEMIRYFTEKGLELNSVDSEGNGAFNYAAKGGNVEMLQWLIDEGVDHQTLNQQGGNAMLFASMGMRKHSNNLEVFKYLDSKGIEANIVTSTGETPLLFYAPDGNDPGVFKFLLSKGADPDHADEDGNTALMLASAYNDFKAVKLLAAASKKIDAVNDDGQTALMYAVHRNSPDAVGLILAKGADPMAVDKDGNNLMYYLVQSYSSQKADVFEQKRALLGERGLTLSATQANGNNLYHLAAGRNAISLLKGASEMGLNINAKNKEGLTPLHIAAMKAENDEVLKYLITQGADKKVLTSFEESAYDLALENELLSTRKTDLKFLEIQ